MPEIPLSKKEKDKIKVSDDTFALIETIESLTDQMRMSR